MRIPNNYKHRVKDSYKDEDGYWIILENNWKCPDSYYSEKTIHEDSYRECIKVLKETRFTLNGGK